MVGKLHDPAVEGSHPVELGLLSLLQSPVHSQPCSFKLSLLELIRRTPYDLQHGIRRQNLHFQPTIHKQISINLFQVNFCSFRTHTTRSGFRSHLDCFTYDMSMWPAKRRYTHTDMRCSLQSWVCDETFVQTIEECKKRGFGDAVGG
jgi:hypothetical protein